MTELSLHFTVFPISKEAKPANSGGVRVGADPVQFCGSGIKELPKLFQNSIKFGVYHSTGAELRILVEVCCGKGLCVANVDWEENSYLSKCEVQFGIPNTVQL